MNKYLKKIFFWLLGIVVLLFVLRNWLPSWINPFARKPLLIENTTILIQKVKSIAQLVSIEATDEVVVDSMILTQPSKVSTIATIFNPALGLPGKRSIVIIGKGKIRAGIDLQQLHDSDINRRGDTLLVKLPKAKVLDAILNPSDFEIFDENGQWSNEEVRVLKKAAKDKLIKRAIEQNLLIKANERSIAVMRSFLQAAGAKQIVITQ
jgi:hypothetical protein